MLLSFCLFKELEIVKTDGIYSVHTSVFNLVMFSVSLVFLVWFLEIGSQHVAQAGLELVVLPKLALRLTLLSSVGTTGVGHQAWQAMSFLA